MKNLLLKITLVFSIVIFPSTSFAEWTWIAKNEDGDTYYMDFDRIIYHEGYVYYWTLIDFSKPNEIGALSELNYKQVECKLNRAKLLSGSFHKVPMGGGTPETHVFENPQWRYPAPNTPGEILNYQACILAVK